MDKNSTALRYGLFAGLGTIVIMLLLYFVNAEMLFGWALNSTWLVYLFCMYKAIDDTKKEEGGFISLREGFTAAFIVFAIANILYITFNYVLMNIIDPSLKDAQYEQALELLEWAADISNMPEKEFDKQAANLEDNLNPSFGMMALGYATTLLGGAIPAVILAAILKKERPMHLQQNDEILDTEA